jgi:putative hemolysin
MTIWDVGFIIGSLIFSAFFSGIEIAFVSVNQFHFELQNKQGTFAGQLLSPFFKRPSRFIATILLGHSLALVIFGIYTSQHFLPYILHFLPDNIGGEVLALFLQILIAGLLMVFLTELLPKPFFLLNPDRLLEQLAIPIWLSFYVLYFPIGWVVLRIYKILITRVLKVKYVEDNPVYRLVDLNQYLQSTTIYSDDKHESTPALRTDILHNALQFKDVKVKECMVPRTEIVAMDIAEGLDTLKKMFLETGHSKIVVCADTIDNVLGYCHNTGLFKKPQNIQSILTPIVIVPANLPAEELLVRFNSEKKSLALVVDEFGGTLGIVSLEDLIEKIFGEIEDEYDEADLIEQKIDEQTYLLSGRHEIAYLNQQYGWKIPIGSYQTLSGFILNIAENLPLVNEKIEYPPFSFIILSVMYSRIDIVKVIVQSPKAPSTAPTE